MKLRPLLAFAAVSLSASMAFAQPAAMQRIPKSDPNSTYCREYQQTVEIGGRRQNSYGTACMQPDGAWKILPNEVQQQDNDELVEYIDEPQYISEPIYVVPPTAYYESYPYYGPYDYPYARSGINFSLGVGSSHHRHDRRHGHGHRHH